MMSSSGLPSPSIRASRQVPCPAGLSSQQVTEEPAQSASGRYAGRLALAGSQLHRRFGAGGLLPPYRWSL